MHEQVERVRFTTWILVENTQYWLAAMQKQHEAQARRQRLKDAAQAKREKPLAS